MSVCPNCGYQSPGDPPVCVNCGTRFRPYGAFPQPAPVSAPPERKNKTPYIILFSLLGVLVVIAVAACVLIFKSSPKHKKTLEYSCAQFTDEFNRVGSEEEDAVQLDPNGWTENEEDHSYQYSGDDFSMVAVPEKNSDENAKMSSLTITPTTTRQGQQAATQSVLVFENDVTPEEAERDLESLKSGEAERIVYHHIVVIYDPEKDAIVIEPIPDGGAESVTPTEKSQNEPVADASDNKTPVYSDFASGDGFVKAGGKYIFTDGKTIRFQSEIDGESTAVIEADNTARLLSNGETLYYVEKEDDGYAVRTVGLDGKNPRTLFTEEKPVVPVHEYNRCLFYLSEDGSFRKYDLRDKTSDTIEDVTFSPDHFVVDKNEMYASLSAATPEARSGVSAYCFNFDTEDWKRTIDGCVVEPYGYTPGLGNPRFDAYQWSNKSNANYANQYIYTLDNGKLTKSAQLPDSAYAIAVSPTSGAAVLCGNSSGGSVYEWWDPVREKADELMTESDARVSVAAVCDTDYPGDIYLYGYSDDSGDVQYFYKVSNGTLKAYTLEDSAEHVSVLAIADGYVLDRKLKVHKLTQRKEKPSQPETAQTTEATTEPTEPPTAPTAAPSEISSAASDYSGYVGTWKKTGTLQSSKSVIITSVEGDTIHFTVNYVYPKAIRIISTDDISGKLVNGRASFTYCDNYDNTGSGTLELLDDHVRITISSNDESGIARLSYEEDLYEHSDDTSPAMG